MTVAAPGIYLEKEKCSCELLGRWGVLSTVSEMEMLFPIFDTVTSDFVANSLCMLVYDAHHGGITTDPQE